TCFGDSNGAISINVTGYSGAYTYTIFDSLGNPVLPINRPGNTTVLNPQPIIGLLAGSYTIQVSETATPFCVKVSNVVTVAGPSAGLTISVTSTPITCVAGNNDGTISALATGGWTTTPYEFQLQIGAVIIAPYSTNPNFTGLTQATYTVYVRDVMGCRTSTNVTLTNPTAIGATVTATTPNLACFRDSTSINISNVTGGQGSNYTYTIKGPLPSTIASGPFPLPAFGSVSISGIPVGNYNVEIRDGWNCFNDFPVAITQPNQLSSALNTKTAISCTQPTVLTLNGFDGTPPYSYSTTLGGVYTPFMFPTSTDITIPNGTTGQFCYYVQDANGCKTVTPSCVTISPLDTLTLTLLSKQDVNCFGDTTGVINVAAQGGLGNYQYTLLNITTGITTGPQSSGNFTNLPGNCDYQVSVVSGDCTLPTPLSVRIDQPAVAFDASLFSISGATCFGNTDGQIVLRITGYVGPLTYVITTSTAIPPVYNSQTIQLPVTQTPPVTIPVTPFDPAVWYATISNLTPNTVSSPPGVIPVVYSDWYSILLQNGPLGCSDELRNLVITRPEPITPTLNGPSVVQALCLGDTASFSITVAGGTPKYSVSLDSITGPYTLGAVGQTVFPFSVLNGGTHTVYIRDNNNCTENIVVVLNTPANFAPDYDSECILNARQYTVNVNSTPRNQVATYSLDGALPYNSTSTYFVGTGGLAPGAHYVDVNVAGCIKRVPFTVVAPIELTVNPGGLNEIVATAQYGSGGYTFTFNGNDNGTNSYIITETGVYTVRVTDSDGCYDEKLFPKTFIPIKIINVYTPGDGGGWSPLNTSNYPKLMTRIYDRYGRMVAELPEGQQWYGKYNGQELPSGDYWYVVKVDESNAEEFVGHFTLYR
ncbi:T9SS type B sorting domain-containing protein, partial [Flavobacterium sp.]|uniref:T9SS type B sorting domain-containing protein n=1 Tax=Flavobacterium sp. TaxID=239 RepID=UPI0037531ECE